MELKTGRLIVLVSLVLVALIGFAQEMARPCRTSDPRFCVFAGAVHQVAAQRGVSTAEAVKLLRAAGVAGFDAAYTDDSVSDLVRAGLRPVNLYGFIDFVVSDGGKTVCAEYLATAVTNGATHMMIIPCGFRAGDTAESDYVRIRDGLRRFAPQVRAAGLVPLIEDFGGTNSVCSYGKYLRRLLDDVPQLDFALDSGNLYYAGRGEDILEMMRYARGRVSHVHLKDQSASDSHAYVTLGLGAVPNAAIVRTVSAWGYEGWYTLENPVGKDTYEDIVRQAAVVRLWHSEGSR